MRFSAVFAFVVLMFLSPKVFAQQSPSDVVFGGEHFFRFRVAVGQLSPEVRAAMIQERFTQVFIRVMAQGHPLTVDVRSEGSVRVIVIAGVPFATATPADAQANQMTVGLLARVWGHNLANGLKSILSRNR